MGSLDWFEVAACRGKQQLFFGQNNSYIPKQICKECPVDMLCLLWAMITEPAERSYRHDVYGGRTPDERDELAKRLSRQRARELYQIELQRCGFNA